MGNLQTVGIDVRDTPLIGETPIAIESNFLNGIRVPADTVVTINGTRLLSSLDHQEFKIDPTNPPTLGPDNILHIVATSVSVNGLLTMDLPCGQPIAVSTVPPVGSSLRNVATLNVSWASLPQNTSSSMLIDANAAAGVPWPAPYVALWGYDPVNGVTAPIPNPTQIVDQTSTGTSVTVPPMTTPGYMLEFSYPGVFVLTNGEGSHGVCVRKIRVFYTNN